MNPFARLSKVWMMLFKPAMVFSFAIAATMVLACGAKHESRSASEFFDGFDIQRYLRSTVNQGGAVTILSQEIVSTGTTAGKPAAIFEVRWTGDFGGYLMKNCSFIHATYDADWKTYESIVVSLGEKQCAPTDPIYLAMQPFRDWVEQSGFTGDKSFLQ